MRQQGDRAGGARQGKGASAPWIICPVCKGDGRRDAQGVVDLDELDDDSREAYLAGDYDRCCEVCRGAGKVREDFEKTDGPVIRRRGRDGQLEIYRDADDASEHFLRLAEGLC